MEGFGLIMRSSALRAAGVAIALVMGVGPAVSQGIEMTPELKTLIEAAKKEGKIQLRSNSAVFGAGDGGQKVAVDGMNRMFGTNIELQWTPGPAYAQLAAQLMQEMQAGQKAATDVYVGTAVQIVPYLERGLWKQVNWTALAPKRIQAKSVEGDSRALRFRSGLTGILYNKNAAPWVKDVKVMADLLKPEYRGKFATTPFLAGYDVLLTNEKWGVEKTRDFIAKLAPQVLGLIGCDAQDRIAAGEIPALAFDCSGGAPNFIRFRDKNILDLQLVADNMQERYTYMTVPAHAPNPNAAALLTVYLSTPEGQEKVIWDYMGGDLTDYPESRTTKRINDFIASGASLEKSVDVTLEWWRKYGGISKAHRELTKIIRTR